jgi:hypothetical protein
MYNVRPFIATLCSQDNFEGLTMGGKALKQCNIQRMSLEQFAEVRDIVVTRLEKDFPAYRIEVFKAYRAKSDFGNLSIVMERGDEPDDMSAYLAQTFRPLQIVSNGDMYSFEVKGHQVDVLLASKEQFGMVAAYYAYNGLGWLLGELAHALGMKLSTEGLTYTVQKGTWKLADIALATTWPEVLSVLGYDFQRWEQGFGSLEDIFEFVASSAYYSSDIFDDPYGYKDVPAGTRLTTRLSMAKWVDENPVKVPPFNSSPAEWQALLFDKFPVLPAKLAELERAHQDRLVAREKFNGQLVSGLTGRTQRDLGQCLARIEESFGGKDKLTAWVLGASASDIERKILEMHAAV